MEVLHDDGGLPVCEVCQETLDEHGRCRCDRPKRVYSKEYKLRGTIRTAGSVTIDFRRDRKGKLRVYVIGAESWVV